MLNLTYKVSAIRAVDFFCVVEIEVEIYKNRYSRFVVNLATLKHLVLNLQDHYSVRKHKFNKFKKY